MTVGEPKTLIVSGEGETLEVKETTGQRVDACETLCAFLNKDGGTVVFGVGKKGKITGQLVSDKTKRELFEENREANEVNREDNADNQTLVMKAIMRNPHLTVRQLATELPISKATVERSLKALQKTGKLRRVGGTRGHWEIVEELV